MIFKTLPHQRHIGKKKQFFTDNDLRQFEEQNSPFSVFSRAVHATVLIELSSQNEKNLNFQTQFSQIGLIFDKK